MKIVFLEVENLGTDLDLGMFQELGEVTFYNRTEVFQMEERIGDADVVAINKLPMNESTCKNAKNLKLVCVTATGVNSIDFSYMNQKGIKVANATDYSTATVAQHTFAMLFYLLEKLSYYDHYVKSGQYVKSRLFTHMGRSFHDLAGLTWGVAGLGHIGKEVTKIGMAFGCHMTYYSTSGRNKDSRYEQVGFQQLLAESDIISVHAPLTPATEKLFDYEAFSSMKREAIFLNLGRGPIVDEEGLARALKENKIAAAGLDVLRVEPMEKENPLLAIQDSQRLLITPHMAWASMEARKRLVSQVYENIKGYIEGRDRNLCTGQ